MMEDTMSQTYSVILNEQFDVLRNYTERIDDYEASLAQRLEIEGNNQPNSI